MDSRPRDPNKSFYSLEAAFAYCVTSNDHYTLIFTQKL